MCGLLSIMSPLITLKPCHPHTPTHTDIYSLSLHDALPIFATHALGLVHRMGHRRMMLEQGHLRSGPRARSEEHTSELQSRFDLVCRLLLEKIIYIGRSR